MAQLEIGSSFAGYHVLDKLGSGGMGAVYLVEHPHLLRREALKIISLSVSDDTEFHQRFVNEARTVAMLNHPGIVAIHHYGVTDDAPWFTMTYVDGTDLTHGGLPDTDVATVATRAATALDYAHRHQVIHRDIKPANIICTREPDDSIDQVVLLDFGIAKLADSTRMTATHAFIGTLAYAAPEIIDGQPAGPASDQYSLACTIYELLTGQAPFEAPTPSAMMAALLAKPAPPISTLRPDLAALDPIFGRALAKDPAQRYPDCAALAGELAAVLAVSSGHGPAADSVPLTSGSFGASAVASPVPDAPAAGLIDGNAPTLESRDRSPHRRRHLLLAAAALILVAALAVTATVWATHRSDSSPVDAVAAPSFTDISIGVFVSCAIRDREAYCWGQNDHGQLGDGTNSNRTTPTKVVGITDVTDISASGSSVCAVASGDAYCWGTLDNILTPTKVPGISDVTDISTNGSSFCAIAGSFLYCWGTNSEGQLGDGTTTERTAPAKVESLQSVTDVSVGDETTCAIADSDAYCFGHNEQGQIGDGTRVNRLTPTQVKDFTYPAAISSGDTFDDGTTCARRSDDAAYCWGDNTSGAIGDGTTTTRLTPVTVLPDTLAVVTGYGSTCAITTTRTLKCWGDSRGPRGFDDQLTPADVAGLKNVTAVSIASGTTCAIADDDIYCWGLNSYGEIGNGTTDSVRTPTKVTFS
ncbi:protein kinase domain-containing protein [Gordonia sp. NPDC003504]